MTSTTARHGVGLTLPLGGALAAGTAGLLARHGIALLSEVSPATGVDDLVVIASCGLGAALAAWLAATLLLASLCLLAAATGRRWRAGERLLARHAPALVRRALAVALGAAVGIGGVGAAQASPAPDLGWTPTDELLAVEQTALVAAAPDGPDEPALDGPDEATVDEPDPAGAVRGRAVAPARDTEGTDGPGRGARQEARTVVVAPGDSLWSITAELLRTEDAATIAASWPHLYEANREVVGEDPDLVHPGQELLVPRILEGRK